MITTESHPSLKRIFPGWAEWREVGDGAMIAATEHGLQGATKVALYSIVDGPFTRITSGHADCCIRSGLVCDWDSFWKSVSQRSPRLEVSLPRSTRQTQTAEQGWI